MNCPVCGATNRGAARFCDSCGSPLASAQEEHRKVVTVLFCDVVGSTALGESTDPEALRALLARYFERMKAIVERHGGTLEKFVGDAVMAVFGVPALHEDDALRACRAALEMRDAFPELGLEGRIGLNSGEVVAGTEERLATGDAVNVAARLEQADRPNEVLIGETTLALVRDAVEAEPVESLHLKGKSGPVAAYRLLAVRDQPERLFDTRFVGREAELELLRGAWERVQRDRRCELVTIVGDAGVGKSRLVAEALAALGTRAVHGRCLPYGEGITYWPVTKVIEQLGALPSDPAAAAAIRSLVGESKEATSAEEIAWAFRKLLEQEAPLVVVFDDIHRGEQTFLDLIEHVALLSTGAPVLLLCMARPELAERRGDWPVTLRLQPLPDDDVAELIGDRAPEPLRDRIAHAAGGNPLFVVEMLAIADQAAEIEVPPTLRALLAARLDQLDAPERHVLEHAAVEGEVFHRGAVQALTPEEPQVTPRLAALVRRELIRPDQAQIHGEDGFRFRHLLIRDTAYDALPKTTRAELHERFARWLEAHGRDLVELDEILGYHLEQAVRYREELGLTGDDELQKAARRRLKAAGRRAYQRQDYRAAAGLLERAAALLPAGDVDRGLDFELGEALQWVDQQQALARASALAERNAAAGDTVGELCARLQESIMRSWLEPEGASERLAALVAEALPVFEAADDAVALCLAHRAFAHALMARSRFEESVQAYERAAAYAERAGLADRFVHWRSLGRLHGPTPLSEVLAWQDGLDERDRREWEVRQDRALATAMLGRIDEARAELGELRAELAERGSTKMFGAVTAEAGAWIEVVAGDPAAAATLAEEGYRLHEQFGQLMSMSSYAGTAALACYELGRLDEAETWVGRAAAGASDDPFAQVPARQARAKVLARRGEHAEAERLAREAVAIGERTDALTLQADSYADLAEVLTLAGRMQEAAEALEQALARYERKENLVMAGRTRARLEALREGAPA